MSISDSEYIDIRNKILEGTHRAVKKLIKERKKTNGELVLWVDGKIKHVRARDLLIPHQLHLRYRTKQINALCTDLGTFKPFTQFFILTENTSVL